MHVQNATLAGGVAVGALANLQIKPWGAMLIGIISGVISTLGYDYVTVSECWQSIFVVYWLKYRTDVIGLND